MLRHVVVAGVLISGLAFPGASPVVADAPLGPISWQSAGDSYSSGEGVYGNVGDCAQSDKAYGPVAERTLAAEGWNITSNTFTACTGHLVEDYFNPRSSAKQSLWGWGLEQGGPDRVDVLTMSFGGNDIGFADIISQCLIGLPDSWVGWVPTTPTVLSNFSGCDESEAELNARIDALLDPPRRDCSGTRRKGDAGFECALNLEGRTGSIIDFYFDIVTQHLTDRGQLYIVGYPRLFAPVDQWPGWVKVACQGVTRGDTEKLGRVSEHLNSKLHEAVDRANQALGTERVHYIDRLALYRDGKHELCGTGEDWLNGIAFNRGDGLGLRKETSFHPNEAGHAAVAKAVADTVRSTFGVGPSGDAIAPGSTGDRVLELQNALATAGYDVGEPDGEFGPRTLVGVQQFQADRNEPSDGIVTPAQFEAAVQLAASAPVCSEAVVRAAVAGRIPAGFDVAFNARCAQGWAVAEADSDVPAWFALLRVRGTRLVPVSEDMGRVATTNLAYGTALSDRRFAELFGNDGWPWRVRSADEVARFIMEGALEEGGTGPAAMQLVEMWLDGDGVNTWNDWWIDFGGSGHPDGPCTLQTGVVDGPLGPGSGPYWECGWIDDSGTAGWIIAVNQALTAATMYPWGLD